MSNLLEGIEGVAARIEYVGNHVLIQGDATEVLDFITGIDLVVMDPPYMLGMASMPAGAKGRHSPWADVINGSGFFSTVIRKAKGALNDCGAIWQFYNWRTMPAVMKAAFEAETAIASVLVWDKECFGPAAKHQLRPQYELVGLIPQKGFVITDRAMPDILRTRWTSKRTYHPVEKPVELVERIISISSPNAVVLDCFAGSGTVAVAAERLGLKSISIEMESGHFETALKRLDKEVSIRVAA